MKFLNVLGRVLGVLFSVLIILSVFMTSIVFEKFSIELYSMSLFEYNRIGAILIIAFAIMCFFASIYNKGI